MNLFSPNLKRNELIKLSKENNFKSVDINVFRNHSFEVISSIINAFLAFSKIKANFNISAYDDSLNYENIKKANLNIIFLDLNNYKNNVDEFIQEKINTLKTLSDAPIITLLLGKTKLKDYDICEILKPFLDENLIIDDSNFEINASRLSNKACISLAQILGLKIIPSFLMPNLKAIIIDLDNTLYDGILGEDGIKNLKLTQNHINLQNELLNLKNQGFLLAIASKNDENDVKAMFKQRKDFLLKISDFAMIKANWQSKDENIKEIAKFFNIGLDSILFIDDNIAEIENTKYLGIKTLLANEQSAWNLKLYPRLYKDKLNKEDSIRNADIMANEQRMILAKLNQEEYFKNLEIKLEFFINENLPRCAELLNKTNQFIANYSRMNLAQCQEFCKENAILSISMSDRLSDSGIIAIFVALKSDKTLIIQDLCISCRALGRKLEKIMIFKAIEFLHNYFHTNKALLYFQKGAKNQPFLDFLSSLNLKLEENFVQILNTDIDHKGLVIESKI
ncbi:HAD-IIIC family phosphatase [Campylobacter lari]|uniref:FkbH domain protein n=1 Tax=Campylobacter lari (strain RM2100 / D67 / ATCC BAA-1060) TaxID=306263 RepID=B9KDI3_CAMLR|nr:HAD-IIIC family phosphatase [Campylobacter lari]ACM64621.1 FkbH domain protein [Campylobacter lari RM2100]EAI3911927.1 HAD-IIIC family phosphatase [Campylobacter lari]EAI4303163.1 HAD-IIIC family phosphatase [Campylobacter lari]EAJ0336999.1 HAD-IIIC family phosphatase [Campylobacter lari]EAK0433314.1 HAD-IIIC family phosphatase [Campylobacter lari]